MAWTYRKAGTGLWALCSVRIGVKRIQVDNQLPLSPLPVLFALERLPESSPQSILLEFQWKQKGSAGGDEVYQYACVKVSSAHFPQHRAPSVALALADRSIASDTASLLCAHLSFPAHPWRPLADVRGDVGREHPRGGHLEALGLLQQHSHGQAVRECARSRVPSRPLHSDRVRPLCCIRWTLHGLTSPLHPTHAFPQVLGTRLRRSNLSKRTCMVRYGTVCIARSTIAGLPETCLDADRPGSLLPAWCWWFRKYETTGVLLKLTLEPAPSARPRGILGSWGALVTAAGNAKRMPVSSCCGLPGLHGGNNGGLVATPRARAGLLGA